MRTLFRSLSLLLATLLAAGPGLQAQTSDSTKDNSIQELHLRTTQGEGAQAAADSIANQGLVVEVTDQNSAPVAGVAVLFRLPDAGATGVFEDGQRLFIAYSDTNGLAAVRNIHWGSTTGPVTFRVTATKGIAHAGILVNQTLTGAAAATRTASPTVSTPATSPAVTEPVPATRPSVSITRTPDHTPVPATASARPSVQISTVSGAHSGGSSKKTWILVGLIAAGAAGGALAFAGKGSASSTPATTPAAAVVVGTPTISIGHP